MGFELPEKTFRITFDAGHELHGLELKTRSVPIGTVLDVMRAAGAQMKGGRPASVEDVESVERLFAGFGAALVEWNLERGGVPVPATVDGVRALGFDTVTVLAMEWVGAMLQASAPLGSGSSGGGTPLDRLPMAPPTPESLAS